MELTRDNIKSFEDVDGTICFIDPSTEVKKKNRHRHIKDGCPKSERGKAHLYRGKNGFSTLNVSGFYAEEERK